MTVSVQDGSRFDASLPRGPSSARRRPRLRGPSRPLLNHGASHHTSHASAGGLPIGVSDARPHLWCSRTEHPRTSRRRHSGLYVTTIRGGIKMTTAPSTRPSGTSAESDALRALYADWSEILATTPDLTIRLFRSIFDEWHQPTREPEDVTYREETVGGVPGIWTLPAGADTSTGPALHARRRLRRRLGVQPPQARGPLGQGARCAVLRPRLPSGSRAPAPRAGR